MHERTIVAAALLLGTLGGCASNEPENEPQAEEEATMSTPSAAPTHDVVSTRVFDAPVERVWRAWSEGERVMHWWGPHGFTTPIADMDFREGGSSFVCMQAPAEMGGELFCNTWSYSKIEPHERIEFTLHFTDRDRNRIDPAEMPGMPPGIPNGVPHVITFNALDENRTEMRITEYGYTTQEAHDTSKAGLEQVLDKLATSLETE